MTSKDQQVGAVLAGLQKLHWELMDAARVLGFRQDPYRELTLIAIAIWVWVEEVAEETTRVRELALARVQDQGKAEIPDLLIEVLSASQRATPELLDALTRALQVELNEFGDERLRLVSRRVLHIECQRESGEINKIVGRALHRLIAAEAYEQGLPHESLLTLLAKLGTFRQTPRTVMDPFFGTGLLAFEVAFNIWDTTGRGVNIWGQERNHSLWALGVVLGAICGFETRIELGDTIRNPRLTQGRGLAKADLVVTALPWGLKATSDELAYDPFNRFVEPTKSFEWLMLQHITSVIEPGGSAVVLTNPGLLFSKGTGAKVRKHWMLEDCIEGILQLPQGAGNAVTSIPPVVLIFNTNKVHDQSMGVAFAKIEDGLLTRNLPRARGRKILTASGIESVVAAYHSGLSVAPPPEGYRSAFRFYDSKDEWEEFESTGFDLSPSRYIDETDFAHRLMATWMGAGEVRTAVAKERMAEAHLDALLKEHFSAITKPGDFDFEDPENLLIED